MVDHLNHIKQIPSYLGYAYDPEMTNIKSLLSEWLKIEIAKCKSRQKRFDPNQLTIYPNNIQKLETSLSVAQLACLFKALKSADVITNSVHMEVLNGIAQSFRTPQVETIALDSLRNKYYNIESRTEESVKEILARIIRELS